MLLSGNLCPSNWNCLQGAIRCFLSVCSIVVVGCLLTWIEIRLNAGMSNAKQKEAGLAGFNLFFHSCAVLHTLLGAI